MSIEISQKSDLLNFIAAQASSPSERLQREWIGEKSNSQQDIQAHLQRLYTRVEVTDEETKARFLTQLHLDEAQIMHALSLPVSIEKMLQASWIKELEQILSGYPIDLQYEAMPQDRCLLQEVPVPFEELLLPFVQYAREQLIILVPEQSRLLSKAAQVDLERWLLMQLTSLAGLVLQLEFSHFRVLHNSLSYSPKENSKERILYERFLWQYSGEGLLLFFTRYSLLARLLIHCVEQWLEVCEEFLERLKADNDQIAQYFYNGQTPGPVMEIIPGCSDPHHHGRSVFLLTFAEGRKLVYKPRCMDIDRAFFTCIEWLNEKGLSPDLKCARILNQRAYGWMEYIEHSPCNTPAEVRSYYQRCGQLLCLFYVLGTTDMHYENLIACGTYPVVVDLETVISPGSFTPPWSLSTSNPEEPKPAEYSLCQTGMLNIKTKPFEQVVNMGALGDEKTFDSLLPHPLWKNINTDTMMLSYETISVKMLNNKVAMHGIIMKPSGYIDDIVTGFRTMYYFLIEHCNEFLAHGGALDLFADCPIRFVFRPTSVYDKQLRRLVHPKFLQDGTSRWIDLQIFKKPLLKGPMDPRLWTLAHAELTSLERLDVPWFGSNTESKNLFTDEGIIVENAFAQSALEQIQTRMASLSDEDLERQVGFIYEIFVAIHNCT